MLVIGNMWPQRQKQSGTVGCAAPITQRSVDRSYALLQICVVVIVFESSDMKFMKKVTF